MGCHLPLSGRQGTVLRQTASRPSSVTPNGVPLRNGMTATGSHEYFYSLRGAQPPGEGIPQKDGTLLRRPTVHPLRLPERAATSPYTPGGLRHSVSAYRIRAGGACRRPCNAPTEVHFLRKKARGEHLGPPRVGSQDQDTAEATAFGTGLQPVHKRHTGGGMALQIPPDPEGPEADELQKYL